MIGYAIAFAFGVLVGWQHDFFKRFVLWAFDRTLGRLVGRFMR